MDREEKIISMIIVAMLSLLFLVNVVNADEMTHEFKNPSFSF